MFIDRVKVRVRAGNGGNGCISFRREKYVPYGGPDGGHGGDGGSVRFRVNPGETTLLTLHGRPLYVADNGGHGQGKAKHGANGRDVVLFVPPGTVVRDNVSGEAIGELLKEGEDLIVARGGRGGKGNSHFASSRRKAPRICQPGKEGEQRELLVELKLVAQGGLVGFPNAGKSTLLRRLTRAHPRVADYPFTTLHPVLGSLMLPGSRHLILADIPGIIQGAHEGVGLGLEFLRHIERTVFLVFVLDLAMGEQGWPPDKAYRALSEEIRLYRPEIVQRPQMIVFNKVDLLEDDEEVRDIVSRTLACVDVALEGAFVISAETGEGLQPLRNMLREKGLEWLRQSERRLAGETQQDEESDQTGGQGQ